MILIYSKKDDLSSQRISQKLSHKNIDNLALFIDDYLSFSSEFCIKDDTIYNYSQINLSEVSAIYFRLLIFPDLPNSKMPKMYQDFSNRELVSLFLGQLMALNVKWINNPFYAHMANYKLVQLKWAKKFGFNIPDTCISTDKKKLFDFYRTKRGKNLVTKAIHMGYIQSENPDEDEAIFTQEAIIGSIDNIPENQPLLLQEKIEADYEIRCFVIGNKILSAKLEFPGSYTDYREIDTALIKANPITLPNSVKEACFQLTKHFNLEYSAIDILHCNEKYFFVDLNSTGDWIWYENNAQLPISDAIMSSLA